jgi:gamma-glutamyltranspeptidase / glutathione hydrolase
MNRIVLALLSMLALHCTWRPKLSIQGMVVSPNPVASQIGVDILKAGGNAVDAAVATGLALGVVDQFNSGLGGGSFLVIRMADGSTTTIDGREVAPAKATVNMYFRNGRYEPTLSRTGVLASGVPGTLSAFALATDKYGTKPLADLLRPSARIARSGYTIDPYYASKLASVADTLRDDAASAHYFHPDGQPLTTGDHLVQTALATTYDGIARDGTAYFYKGPVAQQLDTLMRAQGGVMTATDLAQYQPKERPPVIGTYRGHEVIGMPPASSGGVHVVQILGLLERLREHTNAHDLASAMGFAFYDRHRYLGDTDFVSVPLQGLVDGGYLDTLADKIRAGERPPHNINAFQFVAEGSHTAGYVAVDRWGNAAAVVSSINTTFGAKRSIPGTGIMLNNEMDDFVTNPTGANAYGLTGTAVNLVEPFKRPLSSMSPTIVTKDGKVVFVAGAAGGPMIITSIVQTLRNVVERHMSIAQAVAAPRIHYQWQPNTVFLDSRNAPLWSRIQLSSHGYTLATMPERHAKVQALTRNPTTGELQGGSDPRILGKAIGY